jgi:fluoride ion exporter CrcB/FEX
MFLLTRTHSSWAAFSNIAGQVLGGLLAVWVGYVIGTVGR